ncbi:MAG TPA: hypothetical protein DF383_00100 [Deltaproteobacteria bacterium]|nr:hypothetical protein [Deltaproteobacteria bacterium]
MLYPAVALRALGDIQGATVIYDALRAVTMAMANDRYFEGLTLQTIDAAAKQPLAEKRWLRHAWLPEGVVKEIERGNWLWAFCEHRRQYWNDEEHLSQLARLAVKFRAAHLKKSQAERERVELEERAKKEHEARAKQEEWWRETNELLTLAMLETD